MNLIKSTNIYSSSQSSLQSPKCSKLTQWIPTIPALLLDVVHWWYWRWYWRLLFYPEQMQLMGWDTCPPCKAWSLCSKSSHSPTPRHAQLEWILLWFSTHQPCQASTVIQDKELVLSTSFLLSVLRAYGLYCISIR